MSANGTPMASHAEILTDAGRGRAFAAARRHSGRVRLLKLAIPIGSAVAVVLIAAATYFNPLGRFSGLTLGPLSVSGTKIAMENPRLTGFRKDARPYEVTAKAAYQDIRRPGTIELADMKGRLVLDDVGSLADLVSAAGMFDTSKELLELSRDIRITTSKGDEVLLRSATVDLKAGTVVSKEPVRITTASGIVEAEGVQVSESGRTVSFTGRVRTQFKREAIEPAATASTDRTAPTAAQDAKAAAQDVKPASAAPSRVSQVEAKAP